MPQMNDFFVYFVPLRSIYGLELMAKFKTDVWNPQSSCYSVVAAGENQGLSVLA